MGDPLDFLRSAEVGTLLLITTAGALTCWQLFPSLRTDAARRGVISLQLAFTVERARAILDSWADQHFDGAAKRSQYVDFIYIACYAWVLALLGVLAGRATGRDLLNTSNATTVAAILAIAAWVAGGCDVLEDIGLLAQLKRGPSRWLTAATSTVSTIKWLLALGSGLSSLVLLVVSGFAAT